MKALFLGIGSVSDATRQLLDKYESALFDWVLGFLGVWLAKCWFLYWICERIRELMYVCFVYDEYIDV